MLYDYRSINKLFNTVDKVNKQCKHVAYVDKRIGLCVKNCISIYFIHLCEVHEEETTPNGRILSSTAISGKNDVRSKGNSFRIWTQCTSVCINTEKHTIIKCTQDDNLGVCQGIVSDSLSSFLQPVNRQEALDLANKYVKTGVPYSKVLMQAIANLQ